MGSNKLCLLAMVVYATTMLAMQVAHILASSNSTLSDPAYGHYKGRGTCTGPVD